MVRRHLAERARQIVLAANSAAPEPVCQLVPEASDPEPGVANASTGILAAMPKVRSSQFRPPRQVDQLGAKPAC